MGKIVKYCAVCEEGFAEKFGFCPNCGSQLTAFELNPVENPKTESPKAEPLQKVEASAPEVAQTPAIIEAPVIEEAPQAVKTVSFSDGTPTVIEPAETKESFEFSDEVFEEPVEEQKTFEAAETSSNGNFNDNLYQATYADAANETPKVPAPHYVPDTGYRPTIVQEKNVKQRNGLLLGALVLCSAILFGSYIFSIFNKFLDIAAIDSPDLLAYVGEVDPMALEEEPPPKKNKDNGGGGGGGGKEEEQVTKGREATQVDKPLFAPSAKMDRVTDPDIAIRAATQGNKTNKQTDENYGMPTGLDGRKDGGGSGGGQGNGKGRGQGDGNGTGYGNGNGSGYGGGNGNGNGNGNGDGDNDLDKLAITKKTPVPVGPTEGVKILSKPKALYTDAARQAAVQGKVVLRVTFAANGSIGGISVISGLGNGLTEQAIAAARGIRFEPAKRGGVPYSVQKPVEYSFTIY